MACQNTFSCITDAGKLTFFLSASCIINDTVILIFLDDIVKLHLL